jgi:hypothetical protein
MPCCAISAWENDCSTLNYSGLNAEMMRLQLEVAAARQQGDIYYIFHFMEIQYFLYCIVSLAATDHPLVENWMTMRRRKILQCIT